MPNILPENLVIQRSVPIYGITQLGLRSHPTGSSTLEALTTLSFIRSDKPFFNTPAFRPCSPCYPTQAVAEPIVSHIRNPYLTFPARVHHFHRHLDPGLGRPHEGFSDCGCMDPFRTRAPHQCTGAQGGNIGPQSLGYSITWPSCFDCCSHTTVVAYINKQGDTHSHLLLRLVVDLFLWLQTQDITLRARHILGCLNVIADRLSRPNQPIMTEWSLHPEVMNLIFLSGKSYHLHAWRLLCSTTKQQDFQGRSLSLPQLLHVGDPPQIECTMTGGYASLPGLQGEDLIRLSRVTGPV